MNIGEFNEKISILELSQTKNTFSWDKCANVWAKAEHLKGTNIFSKVGLGAKSVKFNIRKRSNFTLFNALRWKDKHCFITDIIEIDRMYYEVIAAIVEVSTCTVERTGQPIKDSLNRPVYSEATQIAFPGHLIEKYMGYIQETPNASTEVRFVLVTPKMICLVPGEIVNIGTTPYTVIISHTLDPYKNEYEITAKGDV